MLKKIVSKLFAFQRQNAQIIVKFFGIKMKFKSFLINQLEDVCCIQNMEQLKINNVYFPHPIRIVIHPKAIIGKIVLFFRM